jgi:Protein of unknown function (DUF2892)
MSTLKAAFFVKNVPSAERAVRLLLGAIAVTFGILTGSTLGWLVLVSGVMFTATGLFGFCPMCALAGRRLASKG